MSSDSILNQARLLLDSCREKEILLATAESCTGGLIVGTLTEIAGSSDVVDRGFVTYSNEAKNEMLGVPASLIESLDAVSEAVARAMAEGAVGKSNAHLSVAVTGVAGPGGGTVEKPVGLVHIATARHIGDVYHQRMEYGDIGRTEIRAATIESALAMLQAQVDSW